MGEKAIDRLYQYMEHRGVKPAQMERENHLSNGYLSKQKSRDGDLGETILNTILANNRDLSAYWLLTGDGEMLTAELDPETNEPRDYHLDNRLSDVIQKYSVDLVASAMQILPVELMQYTNRTADRDTRIRVERGLDRLLDAHKELSPSWLLLNKGEMVRDVPTEQSPQDLPIDSDFIGILFRQLSEKDKQIKEKDSQIREKDDQIRTILDLLKAEK